MGTLNVGLEDNKQMAAGCHEKELLVEKKFSWALRAGREEPTKTTDEEILG